MTPQRRSLNLSILFTLVATFFHAYLSSKYFGIRYGTAESLSACHINSILNCDGVSGTAASQLWGTPVALWGFVTNLVFSIVQFLFIQGILEESKQTKKFVLGFSFVIALGPD